MSPAKPPVTRTTHVSLSKPWMSAIKASIAKLKEISKKVKSPFGSVEANKVIAQARKGGICERAAP